MAGHRIFKGIVSAADFPTAYEQWYVPSSWGWLLYPFKETVRGTWGYTHLNGFGPLFALGWLLFAVSAWAAWKKRDSLRIAFLVLVPAVIFLFLTLQPVRIPRYIIFLAPLPIVGLAAALGRARGKRLAIARVLFTLAVIGGCSGIWAYLFRQPGYRYVWASLAQQKGSTRPGYYQAQYGSLGEAWAALDRELRPGDMVAIDDGELSLPWRGRRRGQASRRARPIALSRGDRGRDDQGMDRRDRPPESPFSCRLESGLVARVGPAGAGGGAIEARSFRASHPDRVRRLRRSRGLPRPASVIRACEHLLPPSIRNGGLFVIGGSPSSRVPRARHSEPDGGQNRASESLMRLHPRVRPVYLIIACLVAAASAVVVMAGRPAAPSPVPGNPPLLLRVEASGSGYRISIAGTPWADLTMPQLAGHATRPCRRASHRRRDGPRLGHLGDGPRSRPGRALYRLPLAGHAGFWWAPHLAPEPGFVVAQHVFRSPALLTAQGGTSWRSSPTWTWSGGRKTPPGSSTTMRPGREARLGLTLTEIPMHVLFKKKPGLKLGAGDGRAGLLRAGIARRGGRAPTLAAGPRPSSGNGGAGPCSTRASPSRPPSIATWRRPTTGPSGPGARPSGRNSISAAAGGRAAVHRQRLPIAQLRPIPGTSASTSRSGTRRGSRPCGAPRASIATAGA